MIAIIDYKLGNLGSIKNMLKKIGVHGEITSDDVIIKSAEKLILPGVGSFDDGMNNLREMNLIPLLNYLVLDRQVPVLGICLGMQIFADKSEDGRQKGLGWIEGEIVRFRFDKEETKLKIPHMGWNSVTPIKTNSLFRNWDEDTSYYFVHSYHYKCKFLDHILAETKHGYYFASAVQKMNILGTQFHPEKSHRHGMKLLSNFVEMPQKC